MKVAIGIDIGQVADPTAIAVCELQWRTAERMGPASPAYLDHWITRHLERLKLGTPYPDIVKRLVSIIGTVRDMVLKANEKLDKPDQDYPDFQVFVDATGVGRPVTDMLKVAGVKIIPVFFVWGPKRIEQQDQFSKEPQISLGKAFMVSRLQSLLQTTRLHLPRTAESKILTRELLDYEIRVNDKAKDTYGAFKVGTHDDLVTALGLAVHNRPKLAGTPLVTATKLPMPVPTWGQIPTSRIPGLARMLKGLPMGIQALNGWDPDGQLRIEARAEQVRMQNVLSEPGTILTEEELYRRARGIR